MNAYLFKLLLMIAVVFILALGNMIAGAYYNINEKMESFDRKKLLKGLLKAIAIIMIIAALTIAWIIFEYLHIIPDGIVDPYIICFIAACSYFVKLTVALSKILGIYDKLISSVSEAQRNEMIEAGKAELADARV